MRSNKKQKSEKKINRGFSLIETLVASFIFVLVAVATYNGYFSVLRLVDFSKARLSAVAIANEQLEIARNLPFSEVGIVGGLPSGKIPREKILSRGGHDFTITTTVRSIDDPFDGLVSSSTNRDLSPADYKLVQVDVSCLACRSFSPIKLTTTVGPKNLESASGNGALFVKIFDASGGPVAQARVQVIGVGTSTISIDETTDNEGWLQLVDVPPGNFSYKVKASKTGYSSAETYAVGEDGLTNPTNPNATVAGGVVTQVGLAIDRLASLNLRVMNQSCLYISGVGVRVKGNKLLSTTPDVLKYNQLISTGLVNYSLSNLEWDTYNFLPESSTYALAGSLPLLQLAVAPGTDNDVVMILAPKKPNSLLVSVKDAATGLPLSDSSVNLSGVSYQKTITTNLGYLSQTDWSGGAGQWDWVSSSQFWQSDGNISTNDIAGTLVLKKVGENYVQNGWLESSVFDTGSASTTYRQISWLPLTQASSTGTGDVRVQIATSNDPATTTWNYLGPDGTASSFYTVDTPEINVIHRRDRFLRYKIFLQTDDLMVSPLISDLAITYSSECLPFGQAYFDSLSLGPYTLSVSRAGYQTNTQTIDIGTDWQSIEVPLSP